MPDKQHKQACQRQCILFAVMPPPHTYNLGMASGRVHCTLRQHCLPSMHKGKAAAGQASAVELSAVPGSESHAVSKAQVCGVLVATQKPNRQSGDRQWACGGCRGAPTRLGFLQAPHLDVDRPGCTPEARSRAPARCRAVLMVANPKRTSQARACAAAACLPAADQQLLAQHLLPMSTGRRREVRALGGGVQVNP